MREICTNSCTQNLYMGVSENSGFSPQIIHLNRVFHYKPSILGYPCFWKHPYFIWLKFQDFKGKFGWCRRYTFMMRKIHEFPSKTKVTNAAGLYRCFLMWFLSATSHSIWLNLWHDSHIKNWNGKVMKNKWRTPFLSTAFIFWCVELKYIYISKCHESKVCDLDTVSPPTTDLRSTAILFRITFRGCASQSTTWLLEEILWKTNLIDLTWSLHTISSGFPDWWISQNLLRF